MSAWAPLRIALFRRVWTVFLASQVVTWMQTVAAVEVLVSLHASSAQLALVQTATSLPAFLLAVLAGSIADVVDRRALLLVMQAWMLLAACALVVLTATGAITAAGVLLLTFALGVTVAMTTPTFQAVTPDVVPHEQLAGAVSLMGVSINLARAIGPAIGGLLVALTSSSVVFGLEAAIVIATILLLLRTRGISSAREGERAPEHLGGAVRVGLRYVLHHRPLLAVLARTAAFVLPASALWALLPVVAQRELGLGSTGYGVLLGCLGLGAVLGASFLPQLRASLGLDRLIAAGSLYTALNLVLLALLDVPALVGAALVLGGVAWIAVLSSLNTAAQTVAPAWVRARTLGAYQMVFQGGLAGGSAAWGVLATHASTTTALTIAAAVLAATAALALVLRIGAYDALDLRPVGSWPEPHLELESREDDAGPVVVQLRHRVPAANVAEFVAAMEEIGRIRRRDGATAWGLYEDAAAPGVYVELFEVATWDEHVRQTARFTRSDQPLRERVERLTDGGDPAAVHLIGVTRARPRALAPQAPPAPPPPPARR